MGMHRLTDIRSVAQQLARGAVAQWVATGAEVGVDMPHQVPITCMEGSSSKGGTTETPTCPPPSPPPFFPLHNPNSVYTSPSMPLRHPGQRQSKARRSEGVFAAAARLQSESPAWCCQRKNHAAGMAASSCRQLSMKIGTTQQQRSGKQRQHCV